jgi:hypothetical protein
MPSRARCHGSGCWEAMAGRHRSSASPSRCLRLCRRQTIRWMPGVFTAGWMCWRVRWMTCRSRRCAWRDGRHGGMRGWKRSGRRRVRAVSCRSSDPHSGLLRKPPLPRSTGERKRGGKAWRPSSTPARRGERWRGRSPRRSGGLKNKAVDGQAWGVTPEAIALLDRSRRAGRNAQASIATQASHPKRRFHRISPMRPGRPPGWRKRQNHEVYEVLNELHGLAVWASERRDSS